MWDVIDSNIPITVYITEALQIHILANDVEKNFYVGF
jgi:hypothetical protein